MDKADLVEVECERDYFKNELEEARQRIRELEVKVGQLRSEIEIRDKRVFEERERITKARGILETILSLGDWEDVKRALEALEGK